MQGDEKKPLKKVSALQKYRIKELEDEIFVKVRSTGKLLHAKVNLEDTNTADVNLKVSEDGISPGQACVFYKKNSFIYIACMKYINFIS